ncbi:MAG: aldose epimerase family protein [Pseudomonadota bacterium]
MRSNPAVPNDMKRVVLSAGDMRVALLNYGGVTQGWWYKDVPLILGYDDPLAYLDDRNYLGALVGRVANRIENARFELDGQVYDLTANEGPNTLHGGEARLSHQVWDLLQTAANAAVFRLTSPGGAGGFPGALTVEVKVSLTGSGLEYAIFARPDRPTPISIAQHNYYMLGSPDGICNHVLMLASDRLLETDHAGLPSGRVIDAKGAGLDFASPQKIDQRADTLDHYYVFNPDRDRNQPVAVLQAPHGLKMKVRSDQPGAQVYAGAHLSGPFARNAGFCIEPAGYTNAVNIASFPSVIYSPQHPYKQTLSLDICGDCA